MRRLADRLALALDPVELARRAGIEPDPWQAELLRNPAKQILLNCSRQSGKSTVAALLAVHEMLVRPGSLCIMVAPSLRQAQELHRTLRGILAALAGSAPAIENVSSLSMELANRSRAIVLPGSEATVRGYAKVALVIVDEAARIPDELYTALRPMRAVSRGRLVMLSTPWRKMGAFYDAWTNGGADWHRVRLPATECPRIDPDWLEQERRTVPAHVFRQEYLCEFADNAELVFSGDDVRRCLSNEVKPLFPVRAA